MHRHYDRFFLFHHKAPFFQIADLPDDKPLPWSKLLPELASGNNPTLFDHTTETTVPKAGYSQAARALLVHQTFAPGGLIRRLDVASGKGGPLVGLAVFLPAGKTLLETLLLNLAPYPKEDQREDVPIWEASPLQTEDVRGQRTKWAFSGRTRIYTWPTRGVRLLDEGDGVRYMAYGPGVEPTEVPYRDPQAGYRRGKNGELIPLRLNMERSFWRDFSSMLRIREGVPPATLDHALTVANLVEEEGLDVTFTLRVLGQVSDQAKVLDVRREVYPLPPGLLSPKAEFRLETAVTKAENLGQDLQSLAYAVARSVLGEKDPAELSAFVRSLPLEQLYWHTLDGAFLVFLERIEDQDPLAWWQEALRRAAWEAWEATRLFLGTGARHLKALAEGENRLRLFLSRVEVRG